jgi:3-deoxy-manno-octulosonate cytidylyltransferase (CMP-KDO synthetase)
MTRSDHATGTDRLSEVVTKLDLSDDSVVVNVQGDEPLIPAPVIDQVAALLLNRPNASISTFCHRVHDIDDVANANVVKCVLNEAGEAMYFSRATIPFARDAWATGVHAIPSGLPIYRHIGLYAYRASFLKAFPGLSVPAIERFEALEQLRALAHGFRIAVEVLTTPLPPGIDTPEDYERLRERYSTSGESLFT